MLTAGESKIARIVGVKRQGDQTVVLPPCGRCREFMAQVDLANFDQTEVLVDANHVVKLAELLPHHTRR